MIMNILVPVALIATIGICTALRLKKGEIKLNNTIEDVKKYESDCYYRTGFCSYISGSELNK